MCNSAEQSGGDHASDPKIDNGFTLESDLLFIRASNGNGSVGDNIKNTSAKVAEEAAIDMSMQANMQQPEETLVDHSSVVGSVGESECHSRGLCIELEQENIILKYEVSSSVQEENRESAALIEGRHGEETASNMEGFIAAGSEVAESKAAHSGKARMEETVSVDQNAKEHASKSLNEACQNSLIEIEQHDSHVPSTPQLVYASNTKGVNGPELAEFFSNARGSKHEVEIEEHDHALIRVRSPPKRKSYTESPRSLRMLLFSADETVPFAKQEEKHKRDGKSIDFTNKVVPASEGIGDEGHNEDINFPKWHESGDTMEASSTFSGPIAYSGALTYQGMISYTGPVAYSGSVSHRSDSSTSTRSFAFPILASDWNTSPVKMGAPDPRFFRQRRKWHFCLCCRRPSTLFD